MKQSNFSLRTLTGAALLAAAFAVAPSGAPPGAGTALAQGDLSPQKPARHFRVERPAGLSGADALTIYNRILDGMVAGYRLSGLDYVNRYRTWRRYNTVPYRSAQHGERYVNNFANDAGDNYRHFEAAGEMPAGAILVKDSFAVTKRGDVFSGPLFVMEKMPSGFNPASRDWRYVMIMPDGSLFGTTNGEGSERVVFCVTCHKMAGDKNDHLFFIPERHRVRFLN
jgi:hypothetical protein